LRPTAELSRLRQERVPRWQGSRVPIVAFDTEKTDQ